jgi:hypothetical protein
MTGTFLPAVAIDGLNVLIGLVLLFFALKMIIGKGAKAVEEAQ